MVISLNTYNNSVMIAIPCVHVTAVLSVQLFTRSLGVDGFMPLLKTSTKSKQPHPGFELGFPISFPTTIKDTLSTHGDDVVSELGSATLMLLSSYVVFPRLWWKTSPEQEDVYSTMEHKLWIHYCFYLISPRSKRDRTPVALLRSLSD